MAGLVAGLSAAAACDVLALFLTQLLDKVGVIVFVCVCVHAHAFL